MTVNISKFLYSSRVTTKEGNEMENLNNLITLLSKRIEEILEKETALTSEDVNTINELSNVIFRFYQLCFLKIRYDLKIKKDSLSTRL